MVVKDKYQPLKVQLAFIADRNYVLAHSGLLKDNPVLNKV